MMRRFFLCLLGIWICGCVSHEVLPPKWSLEEFTQNLDQLIREHATEDGLKYRELIRKETELQRLTAWMAHTDPLQYEGLERKAFFTNAYNLCVLAQVQSHLTQSTIFQDFSILSIEGVFEGSNCQFRDFSLSLDEIEKFVLIRHFEDPMLHFGLNCASCSCPPLLQAFYPETIDEELLKLGRRFLQKTTYYDVRTDTVHVSRLFEWYAQDFAPDGNLRESLARMVEGELGQHLREAGNLSYLPYDWKLNVAK